MAKFSLITKWKYIQGVGPTSSRKWIALLSAELKSKQKHCIFLGEKTEYWKRIFLCQKSLYISCHLITKWETFWQLTKLLLWKILVNYFEKIGNFLPLLRACVYLCVCDVILEVEKLLKSMELQGGMFQTRDCISVFCTKHDLWHDVIIKKQERNRDSPKCLDPQLL